MRYREARAWLDWSILVLIVLDMLLLLALIRHYQRPARDEAAAAVEAPQEVHEAEIPVTLLPLPEKPARAEKTAPQQKTAARRTPPARAPMQPEPPAPPRAQHVAFRPQVVARGEALLKGQEGTFPPLTLRYDAVGLERYLRLMASRYGQVFIGDIAARRLVARIDPATRTLDGAVQSADLAHLAVDRPRLIQDPGVSEYLFQAASRFGPGEYRVVLLVARWLDAWLVGAIDQTLRAMGRPHAEFVGFHGAYELHGNTLVIRVTRAIDRQGQSIPLRLVFDLRRAR